MVNQALIDVTNVSVKFFATLKEVAGRDEIALTMDGRDAASLKAALVRELAGDVVDALYEPDVRIAVNQSLVHPPFLLDDGDEVAFLPPVTGG